MNRKLNFRRVSPIKFTLLGTLSACLAILFVATNRAADREYDPSSFTWHPERSPSGPVVVSVNLKTQRAAVYRNGIVIGTCEVATGRDGFKTPTGVFHILEKDADHHSSTYNNAAMPFSERLTWGGVALHAGNLPGYPSSHGCVHLPFEFSKKLFEVTQVGGTVIISDEAPDDHVTDSHRIEFVEHKKSDLHWTPHESGSGPVSILFSSSDKQVQVIRNGVLIGRGEAHYERFAEKPHGTYAFIFDGWRRDASSGASHPHWHQVSGPPDSHQVEEFGHIKADPRLKHILDTVVTPGTTLVITNDPISKATRSQPGFRIMSGMVASSK